jgi:hypothetical protein
MTVGKGNQPAHQPNTGWAGSVETVTGNLTRGNSRNGKRAKTVITDNAGPVAIEVPRGREASFEPVIVRKRQRRLSNLDQVVLSLSTKGLTAGEISAHLGEVYGAEVSKDTVTRATDRVIEGDAVVVGPTPGAGLRGDDLEEQTKGGHAKHQSALDAIGASWGHVCRRIIYTVHPIRLATITAAIE